MKIIDGHSHVASSKYFHSKFLDGIVDNMYAKLVSRGVSAQKAKIRDLYLTKMQDHLCDEFVGEMDAADIDKAVLLLPDYTWALGEDGLTIEEMMLGHREILNRHPDRLKVFAGVDPRWGKDGVALFERAITEFGFHGMKVYPPCGYTASDPSMYPFYEICAHHQVPVLLHTGPSSPVLEFAPAHPMGVDKAARDFPGVNFILAHGAVSYVEDCAMLCSHRPNVYLDVSGYFEHSLAGFRSLFGMGISHKIIFGTDWPIFRLKGSHRNYVNLLRHNANVFPEAWTQQDSANFWHRNMERLLSFRTV